MYVCSGLTDASFILLINIFNKSTAGKVTDGHGLAW